MAELKIKYTKTERARQKKILKVSLRMLPLFEAMEKSLMVTINSISENIERIQKYFCAFRCATSYCDSYNRR